MTPSQEKRLVYISLIGLAALLPLVINPQPQIGGLLSIVGVSFVMMFIRSDRKRSQSLRGFPVLPPAPTKTDPLKK